MAGPIPTTSLDSILDTPKPGPRFTYIDVLLVILVVAGIAGGTGLLCLLALDVFYIPYLTEFTNFLVLILSPFVPLLLPVFIGIFLKVCQHQTWPRKTSWVFVTAWWAIQHLQRLIVDTTTLYGGGDICGLGECKAEWLEWTLVGVVVLGQIAGWRWDAGYVDCWIEHIIMGEAEKQAKVDAVNMAKGVIPQEVDLEKAEELESVVCKNVDEEKRDLMTRDEMVVEDDEDSNDLLLTVMMGLMTIITLVFYALCIYSKVS